MEAKQNRPMIVVARSMNCWGKGKDVAEAVQNCKSAGGLKRGSQYELRAYVSDDAEALKSIRVDDIDGSIWYGNQVESVKLGRIKL